MTLAAPLLYRPIFLPDNDLRLENAGSLAVRHRRGERVAARTPACTKPRSLLMDELTTAPADGQGVDARRYFEAGSQTSSGVANKPPVCLYLEVTNRCNLLCTTCPRTYAELEPPADMSWQLFTRIVDQVPDLARAVLHGVGEPMLVKDLPRMVRYLKDRGAYVLFNTNGTVLNDKNGRALIAAGLDELRVSLDASTPESYHQSARQGLLPPHPAKRQGFPGRAGTRGSRQAAGSRHG